MVYDPDLDLVTDLAACEDAYESERTGILPLLDSARPRQLWMADQHFCTRAILQSLQQARADFIVRQDARHPLIVHEVPWHDQGRVKTGWDRYTADCRPVPSALAY